MLIFLVLFKDVFPESDFASDSFADVPVRVLRPQSAHAKEVQGWLIDGVYDALKRKYVSKVQLSIGAAHDSSAQFFEEYSFCISYNDGAPVVALDFPSNGGSVSLASAEELQYNRVTRMLRSMVTFLTPMPDLIDDDKRVSMRLLYTPDCPPDYEPCYFRAMRADSDARLFPQPTAALSEYEMLELGSLDTPYHTLSLTLTSRELDDDDTSIEPARLMQFALNGGAVDLDCDDSDDQSPDGDVVYDTATPLSEPYGGGGGGGYDDDGYIDDDDGYDAVVVADNTAALLDVAPATPRTPAASWAASQIDIDENLAAEIEFTPAKSGVSTPLGPAGPPPLRPVLAAMTQNDLLQRRAQKPPVAVLPALETALSQLKTPAASPMHSENQRQAWHDGSTQQTPGRHDRETLRSLRNAAVALLASGRVGDVITIARLQQSVVADAELAALLLRRFEDDGLVRKQAGKGFVVTKKGVRARAQQ
jgi:hypothetical protein